MRFSTLSKAMLPVLGVCMLAGCKSMFYKPYVVPTGYTYHKNDYKFSGPDMAEEIGYTYTAEENAKIVEMWRPKVAELINNLEMQTGMRDGAVYIVQADQKTAHYMTFDHILRDELRARGYTISSDPAHGKTLAYDILDPAYIDDIRDIEKKNDIVTQNKPYIETDYKEMMLQLVLSDAEALVAEVSGVYVLPMFGYKDKKITATMIEGVMGQKSIGEYDAREKSTNE